MDGPAVNSAFGLYYHFGSATLFGVPVIAAIAGTCIQRVFQNRFYPILFSTPVADWQLTLGRFVGATGVLLLIFSCVPLGCFLATITPSADPDFLVENEFGAYFRAFVFVLIPNVVICGAIFFSVAAVRRNMMEVYLAASILYVVSVAAHGIWTNTEFKTTATVMDPMASHELVRLRNTKTIDEWNVQYVPITSEFLLNRIVWLLIGTGFVANAIYRLRRERTTMTMATASKSEGILPSSRPELPMGSYSTGPNPYFRMIPTVAWRECCGMILRPSFLLVALATIVQVLNAARFIGAPMGTSLHPTTSNLLPIASGNLQHFVFLVTVIYAGQLVWRERDACFSLIYDALPMPTWLPFVARLVALMGLQLLLYLIVLSSAVVFQAACGHFRFEWVVYAKAIIGVEWFRACLFGVAALTIHVLVNHKFIAHVVILLLYVMLQYADQFGIVHHLVRFASHPGYTHSDMIQFGDLLWPIFVLNSYWACAAILLTVLGSVLWVRGYDRRELRRSLKMEFGSCHRPIAAAALVGMIVVGGFIYYNTNVLNNYRSPQSWELQRARYEHTYVQFKQLPQPKVEAASLSADIFPDRRMVRIQGSYRLRNRTDQPIDRILIHVVPDDTEITQLTVGDEQGPAAADLQGGHYVFELTRPMASGEIRLLKFAVIYRKRGFTNHRNDSRIVDDGTYFGIANVPHVGYNPRTELLDNRVRARYGLVAKERVASINDDLALQSTFLGAGADWVDFDIQVSTPLDQISVAPGTLQREWRNGRRRYFQFRYKSPMRFFFSVLSGQYDVHREQWNDTDIEVFYHPEHEYNVRVMAEAARKSLEYYTTRFGPYQSGALKIVETPRVHAGAMAFPGTIPFSEGAGFVAKPSGTSEDMHYAYFTTAHEVAHQWWGHQLVGGNVEGVMMLSESLAQYSALMVMKHEHGPQVTSRLLRSQLDRYLAGRAKATEEWPLMRDHGHDFVHYHKGAVVLFALQEYLGEDVISQTLSDFVADNRFRGPPYPTSDELVQRFREVTPPDLRYVVEDWFEQITIYDLRATSATSRRLDDGRYQVQLTGHVAKFRGDREVTQAEIPMNDWIEVGVSDAIGTFLHLDKHRLKSGHFEIEVVVDREPTLGGIDPRNLLVDREPNDNITPMASLRK